MHCGASLVPIVAFIAAAFAQSGNVPPCLADCLRNATNPCDQDSLGWLFNCLNDQCIDTASGITLMLTPKVQYSCQDSLIPGMRDSSSAITVVGNASCVTNPYDFESFIPSTGLATEMSVVAQKCELELFPVENCSGNPLKIDLNTIQDAKCAFGGGRSVRMSCGQPVNPNFNLNPYRYLERMCANSTSTSSNSSSPTSYGSTPGANATVHILSIGSHHTPGAIITPYATGASDHTKTSLSSGLANNEQTMKQSLAALVAVLAAAIVML